MSQNDDLIKVGFVGAGGISEAHASALARSQHAQLVGICELDAEKAREFAERYGVEQYPSIDAMVKAGISSIHVLTPPHTHALLAEQALMAGAHVFVEKPFSTEPEDCDRLQSLADGKGLQVATCHSLLYDPQIVRLLKHVEAGKLGKIVSVDILRGSNYPDFAGGELPPWYRDAGYPFRDLGVHCFYLIEKLLGPIKDVTAAWDSLGGDRNLAFDEWRAHVKCRDGLAQFQLSWNAKPMQSQIIVQGTNGCYRGDLFLMFGSTRKQMPLPGPALRVVNAMSDIFAPAIQVPLNIAKFLFKRIRPYHGLQELVQDHYYRLSTGLDTPVKAGDATNTVLWTEKIATLADQDFAQKLTRAATGPAEVDVLVTGATGSLGKAIVSRLRSEGKRVRVMVRKAYFSDNPELEDTVIGDLGDRQAVLEAVKGARTVIHAGAAMGGGWDAHLGATVQGTKHVLEACGTHSVERLVHVSSMSVVDWAGSHESAPVNEQTPLEPNAEQRGHYTRAKLEAEKLVVEFAKNNENVRCVLLRPGQIFGGGIPLLTGAVARRAAGRWIVLGDGELSLPLVHINDVVGAVEAAMKAAVPTGEIYQIIDHKHCLTQNQVLDTALGSRARVLRVPSWIVFSLGYTSELMLGILGKQSPLSRYRLRSGLSSMKFESNKAQDELGWEVAENTLDRIADSQG